MSPPAAVGRATTSLSVIDAPASAGATSVAHTAMTALATPRRSIVLLSAESETLMSLDAALQGAAAAYAAQGPTPPRRSGVMRRT